VDVTLAPADSSQAPRTLQGSAQGTLTLDGVPAGRYRLEAARWLADSERTRLSAGDDAVGFVTKTSLAIAPASPPAAVRLAASRRRSIVLTEWAGLPIFTDLTGSYDFNGYFRLYNNADTTVYLDGVIVGDAYAAQFDYPTEPCSTDAELTNDPEGVWAHFFQQLPGRGRDFPLAPGQTAVLATDAIDHRSLAPGGLDLRGATFEFSGYADVDNPAVPNAQDIGVGPEPLGHGLIFSAIANVVFVSSPVNAAVLPRKGIPPNAAFEFVRFPKDRLLEVVAIATTYSAGDPECPQLVNANFDRRAVQLLGSRSDAFLHAYHRLTTPVTIGGQLVLQHTRTSAADFVVGDRTPFARP